mgnify:CR=1 FL=1
MVLAIATNNAALNAAASASSVNRDMETSMARLSSGKRINSASDDAAGVAISSRLSAEIRGTDQAIRNALDGQALIDTAEGAHKEVENILQRMREIGVQAMNDTNSSKDRINLFTEIQAMAVEINRIASTTKWAGQTLMGDADGAGGNSGTVGATFSFQVGASIGEKNQIVINIGSIGFLDLTDKGIDGLNLIEPPSNAVDEDNPTAAELEAFYDNPDAWKDAVTYIDNAIKNLNTQRSELGAVSNRLNHTVNNLTNISSNLSAAKGGIEDADFALETTNLAKNQILQQASTAMLAQANASKQNVLSLLQG